MNRTFPKGQMNETLEGIDIDVDFILFKSNLYVLHDTSSQGITKGHI